MIRFVADTNVYVSAAISPNGSSMALIRAAERGEAILIMSDSLLSEIEEVLEREKFRRWVTLDEVADFLSAITLLTEWIDDRPANEIPQICQDPDDNFLVALAQDANSGIIVSGDSAVQRIEYPNILIYSPSQALDALSFRHEWGEDFIPGDFEMSRRQIEAEGSSALLNVYVAFHEIFEQEGLTREQAAYFLQFVAVPSAIPAFLDRFDDCRVTLQNRGLGTRPMFASPDVAYLKLPPDPGAHLVATADGMMPPDTILVTLQRCHDLQDDPALAFDHWRVFGIGPWPLEDIPPRPST